MKFILEGYLSVSPTWFFLSEVDGGIMEQKLKKKLHSDELASLEADNETLPSLFCLSKKETLD